MCKSSRLFGFVVLVVFGVVCGLYFQLPAIAQDKKEGTTVKGPAAAIVKWEYRIVVMQDQGEREAEKELNALGEQGFEIAFQTSSHRSQSNARGTASDARPVVHYTLRRIKQ
jgi:hypothetical protein